MMARSTDQASRHTPESERAQRFPVPRPVYDIDVLVAISCLACLVDLSAHAAEASCQRCQERGSELAMTQDFDGGVSRRQALTLGGGLLAGCGLGALLPGAASAAPEQAAAQQQAVDLALFRPVSVSSTDYAATPAEFAVDGLAQVGVQGSGWRAGQGDGQWMIVDLQGRCEISSVVLTFEAKPGDPAFDANASRAETIGTEILSSYAVVFDLDVSDDGRTWKTVHHTESGTGGVVTVALTPVVKARWVRFSATRRSTTNPLGLNGLQVYGTSRDTRPAVQGWTNWPVRNHENPALTVAADGSVPLE